MIRISRRRAFVLSLMVHATVLMALLTFDVHAQRERIKVSRVAAARAHDPVLQRNEAETYAEHLGEIRKLSERIEGDGRAGDGAGRSAAAEKGGSDAPSTAAIAKEQAATAKAGDRANQAEMKRLFEQSRKDYTELRERLLGAQAKQLSAITGQSVESARAALEAQHPSASAGGKNGEGEGAGKGSGKGNGSGAGAGSASDRETEIARMHADAERLLAETVHQQRNRREGQPLAVNEVREAYRILDRSQQLAEEAQEFSPAVDWTALMGKPFSGKSVNGMLDTEDSFRRVETDKEHGLRATFRAATKQVRFTRRVGATGTEAVTAVCPDAWYIVGPFENAGRSAVDRSFPPEYEIDRDATYTGKNGQPISWSYVRVHNIAVIPPHLEEYAIYYAYTEVYSAQPVDCWLAIGSDDHSKMWVNGLLVWADTRNQKSWSPTEGFRRVHLDAGFNRFLFRLENGWNGAEFSVVMLWDQ